LVTVWSP